MMQIVSRGALASLALTILAVLAAGAPTASASTFTPANTAFNLQARNFTVTLAAAFTVDCTTSTIAATTANPAAGFFSTPAAMVTFAGCTATLGGSSCAAALNVGGGNWTVSAGAAIDLGRTSWRLAMGIGSPPPAAGAITIPLAACRAGCSVTVPTQVIGDDPLMGVSMLWTNGTLPTVGITARVGFTGAGCGPLMGGNAVVTVAYTLTSATDINLT